MKLKECLQSLTGTDFATTKLLEIIQMVETDFCGEHSVSRRIKEKLKDMELEAKDLIIADLTNKPNF